MKSRTATRRWPVRCAPTGPTALSSRSGSSTRRACRSSPATISCTMCGCSTLRRKLMSTTMPRWVTASRSAGSARRTWPTPPPSTIRRPVSASIPPTVGCSSTARRTTRRAGRWRTSSAARRTATATSSPGLATWPTRTSWRTRSPARAMLNDTAAAGNSGGGSTFTGHDRGEVYFYAGNKQATGLAIDKAGLTGGGMYGVKVAGLEFETDLTTKAVNGSHFDLVAVGNDTNTSADVHNLTGAQIETNSQSGHVTGFERPEDGAWDTIDHDRFYFVTTASITGHSKLWELDFDSAKNPTLGGTIKMLLDGTEGQLMFDNITVSQDGRITLCEDPGNNDRVAKSRQYDPANA